MFDGTFFASESGGATRDWTFSTTPVTQADADTYIAALSSPAAKLCSGDILQIPTMCSPELPSGKPTRAASSNRVVLDFMLHESQPAKVLLRYAPGDVLTGESFTRSTVGYQLNGNISNPLTQVAINAKRDTHYINSVRSILLEAARTNVVLHNRNLANAAWTKTNMTAAQTSTGADGVASSATRLTATAGNATALQAITLGSSARFQTAWVKRITGTGSIQMTMDNGATWTTVTTTAAYSRVTIPTQTLANPTVGFRIVTSGDAIDVDFVQNEDGTFASSEIATTTVAVTRGSDSYSLPFTTPPQEMTVYVKFVESGTSLISSYLWSINSAGFAAPNFFAPSSGGLFFADHVNAANVFSSVTAPTIASVDEVLCRLFGDGSVDITQSVNGAAATTGTQSAGTPLASAWSGLLLWLNSGGSGSPGFTAIQSFKVVSGARSLAEMRAL